MISRINHSKRYRLTLGVLLSIVLVLAGLEAAAGHTAMSARMQMPTCDMGIACPDNNATSCLQGLSIAVPAVTPFSGDLHPQWTALPVQPTAAGSISDSGAVIFTEHTNRAVPSGPPLHLRFCAFLK